MAIREGCGLRENICESPSANRMSRKLLCAENQRQRSLLLSWERFLRNFLDRSYVSIAPEKARWVIITLARTARMTATANH
jgi:hypothetical protein